jgi:hypothetical protein
MRSAFAASYGGRGVTGRPPLADCPLGDRRWTQRAPGSTERHAALRPLRAVAGRRSTCGDSLDRPWPGVLASDQTRLAPPIPHTTFRWRLDRWPVALTPGSGPGGHPIARCAALGFCPGESTTAAPHTSKTLPPGPSRSSSIPPQRRPSVHFVPRRRLWFVVAPPRARMPPATEPVVTSLRRRSQRPRRSAPIPQSPSPARSFPKALTVRRSSASHLHNADLLRMAGSSRDHDRRVVAELLPRPTQAQKRPVREINTDIGPSNRKEPLHRSNRAHPRSGVVDDCDHVPWIAPVQATLDAATDAILRIGPIALSA